MDDVELRRQIYSLETGLVSVRQTMDEVIKPKLEAHDALLDKFNRRWVYALTIIGASLTTAGLAAAKGMIS